MSGTERQHSVTRHFEAYSAGNRWGELYDSSNPASHSFLARRRKTVELLGDFRGRLLDMGCGTGSLIELLPRDGVEYRGVDIAPGMIDVARGHIQELGLSDRFQVQQGDVTAVEFPDASFDAAVGLGLLEYFDDPGRVIREAMRVVRPGGRLVFTLPLRWSADDLLVRATAPFRAVARLLSGKAPDITRDKYTRAEIRALFVRLGCEPAGERDYNKLLLPYPFSRLAPRSAARSSQWAEDRGFGFFATGHIAAFRRV